MLSPIPRAGLVGFWVIGAVLLGYTAQHYPATTLAITAASLGMFAACFWSAWVLLGARSTWAFTGVGVTLGWWAEQMGSSRGWFFGQYTYTDVLGMRLGDVPVVIPLMWFALPFACYVLASLMLWQRPIDPGASWPRTLLTAFMASMVITAFDLGADPYFVYVLKAWIMEKPDGGWFGETLQGFVGWMEVSFAIVVIARWVGGQPSAPTSAKSSLATWVPLAIYGSQMVFQALWGYNSETRTLALFAMGIPTLVASVQAWRWTNKAA